MKYNYLATKIYRVSDYGPKLVIIDDNIKIVWDQKFSYIHYGDDLDSGAPKFYLSKWDFSFEEGDLPLFSFNIDRIVFNYKKRMFNEGEQIFHNAPIEYAYHEIIVTKDYVVVGGSHYPYKDIRPEQGQLTIEVDET